MAASLAKLCLAAALAQQVLATAPPLPEGPLPFMPSVGIAAYQGCVEATADIHEDDAIHVLRGGASCDKLNATRLLALGLDDCVGTVIDISSLMMTFECVYFTAADELMNETCFLPKKGEQLEGCKTLMDNTTESFTPQPIEELAPDTPDYMLDSFEVSLAVFGACSSAVESIADKLEKPGAQEIAEEIDTFCLEETDKTSMETMGVTDDDCKTAMAEPLKNFFKMACVYNCMYQVEDPSAVSLEGLEEKVGEFADHFGEIEKEMEEGGVEGLQHGGVARALLEKKVGEFADHFGEIEKEMEKGLQHGGHARALQQNPLGKRLLRLHSLVSSELRLHSLFGGENGKPLGEALRKPLRKSASWSLASVALAAAASASALAALGLLAWRRHLAKDRPKDIEPILCAQDTQE